MKSPFLLHLRTAWSQILHGKPYQGLWYLWRLATQPLRDRIGARPVRFASMLRLAPGMVAIIGLMPLFVWLLDLDSPLRAIAAAAVLTVSIYLLLLSFSLYWLSVPALAIFLPFERRLAGHVVVLFGVALGVAARHVEWDADFTKELAIVLCVWMVSFRLVDFLFESLAWQRRHRIEPINLGKDRVGYEVREYWLICVHEAGHLLMYGLLSKVPEDAFAMADRNPRFGMGGFATVFSAYKDSEINTRMLSWMIQAGYGGAAAEELVFGSHGEGVSADFEHGDTWIRRLAAILPEVLYFTNPANETEQRLNADAVVALRQRHFEMAKAYLALNQDALLEVAEFLREHESMNCEEFAPVWQRLRTPDGQQVFDPPGRLPCLPVARPVEDQVSSA